MFSLPHHLTKLGILGINNRNANFILKYNPRHLFPLVDDKLRTKKLAQAARIAVPKLYGVAESQWQVKRLPELLKKLDDFVIKPACGSGGDGILVIVGQTKNKFRQSNGVLLEEHEIRFHVANILSGMYSLGGHPDNAIIEYRIKHDMIFEDICYQGVPDIRIIVFQGVPVMAMIRLPTKASSGKANLHQGAIGAGIDIATGVTMSAVLHNEIVTEHPDTGVPVEGVRIPNWRSLLKLASQCYELTGLGYIGVDIALDKDLGPLILELNARPGLNIQIANKAPLLKRLRMAEEHVANLKTIEERVEFAIGLKNMNHSSSQ